MNRKRVPYEAEPETGALSETEVHGQGAKEKKDIVIFYPLWNMIWAYSAYL